MKKRKTIQAYLTLCIVFFYFETNAQKQASIWFTGNGNGIDFSKSPLKIIENTPEAYEPFATIADKDGNLLFYCNHSTVWNAQNEIIEDSLDGTFYGKKFIFPRPGSETQFYIFQVKDVGESTNSTVLYSLVDMEANGGAGSVILKNELLYANLHGSITAGGNCEAGYWFVGETGTNVIIDSGSDQIYAFKIDEEKVHETPVISEPVSIGNSGNYRLSPDGKKLFFIYSGNNEDRTALADFDLQTGEVKNLQNIGPPGGLGEFSADGRFLYVKYSESLHGLFQYDLSKSLRQYERISNISTFHQMQLAPNGKIYMLYNEGEITKMAVINHPEKFGSACDIEADVAFPFANDPNPLFLPEFASNLLYKGPDLIDAGSDREICSGESIVIGGVNDPAKKYEWFPGDHLDNPFIANPSFTYLNHSDSIVSFTYNIKSCESDMMKIKVFPEPKSKIYGSKSVCPGVELVDYWADSLDNVSYTWFADGGMIAGGHDTNSVKVNWGQTNPNASVSVLINNQFSCPADTLRFQVRINVELQTETPLGEDLLCANLGSGIPYGITNTNGSIYTWESDVGNIISGQGSNSVIVDWPGDGLYHIWVNERSTTIDTVCYGVSDSLLVNLFTDPTNLELDFVGIHPDDKTAYELQWYISDTTRLSEDISIYASQEFTHASELITLADKKETYYSYADTSMNFTPMSFKIASVNGCREKIESEIHTAIFLSGTADSVDNSMSLQWTPYHGWGNKIMQYEILYRKDDDLQFSLVASLPPGQTAWSNNWGDQAFLHHYRIRAIHSSYPFESWSNELTLSFNHSFEIPNVFTPNGDGINDTFSFPELELFRENELTVIDRYGKEVFRAKNYDGHWNGAGLASGTYYYSFQEYHYGKSYKGWVRLLR